MTDGKSTNNIRNQNAILNKIRHYPKEIDFKKLRIQLKTIYYAKKEIRRILYEKYSFPICEATMFHIFQLVFYLEIDENPIKKGRVESLMSIMYEIPSTLKPLYNE